MAITALAGPVSNFIMGFLSVFFLLKLQVWVPGTPDIVLTFLYYSAIINTGLSIFNLIPIMPLDGSRILAYFLPERLEAALAQYGTYIQLGLLLLLFTGILSGPLSTMVNTLLKNFDYLVRLIP
ncbi:MAG TPA: site-2 protease family protein [Clostridia bacterium]|nr:site-2 protease family protein [Clostridia bacterium]